MFKLSRLAILALVFTASCVGSTEETAEEELGSAEQPFVSYITGTWTKGQGPQALANWNDYFCFLSKVTGNFAGGGEWVDVYGSNGQWWIAGGAGTAGLGATAMCVNYRAFSNTAFGWTPASVPVTSNGDQYVGPLSDMTWLSGMGGRWSGGGEWLSVYSSADSWRARANSMNGYAVTGRAVSARLMTPYNTTRNVSYFGQVSQESQIDGTTYDNADLDLGSDQDRICYLVGIQGKFNGYGEWAEVKRSFGRWQLRVESGAWKNGIKATAQCVSLF